jgi:uncharacterized protein (UPF0335 family)
MDADAILKDAYRRWLNIEEAKEAAQEDGKELMAELKAGGFLNTKAVRAAFRRERMSEDAKAVAADEAFEAEVDLIRASLARDAHVRGRAA